MAVTTITSNEGVIQITEQNGELLVDSRLIAAKLGLDHGTWMTNTVKRNQVNCETAFGSIHFDNGSKITSSGRINPKPERFAYLTENQALFFMSCSQNTQPVINCKIELIKKFDAAKKRILELEAKKSTPVRSAIIPTGQTLSREGQTINSYKIACFDEDNFEDLVRQKLAQKALNGASLGELAKLIAGAQEFASLMA
jgi:phage regulator Rha-like protein